MLERVEAVVYKQLYPHVGGPEIGHKIWGPISHSAGAQEISAGKVRILDKLSHQPHRTSHSDDGQ